MKYFKLILTAVLVTAIFYLLNTKIGSIPPLGKFLNPATGFWQNETSEISNETIDIPGLSQPADVFYDQHQIPHIFAQNQEDLAMAQGYVTAKDRLWQMEFQTHAAAGRISEIFGEAALNYDRGQRRKGMVYGAEMAMKAMENDPEIVRLLDAFTSGINHYISELEPDDYPIEYKLLDYQPEHWERIKVGLLLMYMTDMLTGGDSDFEYTNFINKYGKERFDFIYPDFFEVNDPVIPADKKWDDLNAQMAETPLSEVPKDTLQKAMEDANPDNGSNNWAIAPELSYSGNAILANDPHLGLNLPSIWYVMQLHTPEFNVMGATLPGVYGVISGFNNNIAWGVTNATRDVRDWYKIEFKDKNKEEYRYADEWRPTTKRVETIKIRNKESLIDTVVYTHNGPVSYDDNFNLNKEKVGYALKWIGHLGGNVQRTFVELNRGKNYEDYVEALKYYHAPAQNFVFASTEGDIALWVQGKFPNKWKGQGKFLLDGSKPEHDWQGYIPHEHNAFVKNPERGFVSSANQHPVDPSYPYYVFNDGYETYRNRVINDFIRSKDKFNIEDFKTLHNNNYNLKAAELLPYLIENIKEEELTESEKQILNIVKIWNYYNEVDSKGASIWEAWSSQLFSLLWDEFDNEELSLKRPFTYRTIELIKNNPNNEFMDIMDTPEKENAQDLINMSFKKAYKELEDLKNDGGSLEWAKYKGTYAGHLLQALPAFSRFDIPIGGNRNIVNAASKNHGPSWRMIVEMSTPPKAMGIYPGGQSGNPGSKYYDNFIDSWAEGEYLELLFYQDSAEAKESSSRQTLNPVE